MTQGLPLGSTAAKEVGKSLGTQAAPKLSNLRTALLSPPASGRGSQVPVLLGKGDD